MKKRNQWLAVLSMTAILTAGATSYTSMIHAADATKTTNDHVVLRTAIQNMQGTVTWNGSSHSVDIQIADTKVQLPIGTSSVTINGVKTPLDSKSYITKGTTYVSSQTLKLITDQLILKQNKTGFEQTATFQMPGGKAEISASTPDGQRLLVTEADNGSISVLDIADLKNVNLLKTVSFQDLSAKAEVTSVTVSKDGKYGLAVIRTGDTDSEANKGLLAIVDLTTYKTVKTYELGIGPDSIALSPDGLHAVIAIEDEELNKAADEIDYANTKRPGSIMVVSFAGGNVLEGEITNLPVSLENVEGAIYPHDPQPEYVAISPDNKTAAITLQENNVVALVDLETKKSAQSSLWVLLHIKQI